MHFLKMKIVLCPVPYLTLRKHLLQKVTDTRTITTTTLSNKQKYWWAHLSVTKF